MAQLEPTLKEQSSAAYSSSQSFQNGERQQHKHSTALLYHRCNTDEAQSAAPVD